MYEVGLQIIAVKARDPMRIFPASEGAKRSRYRMAVMHAGMLNDACIVVAIGVGKNLRSMANPALNLIDWSREFLLKGAIGKRSQVSVADRVGFDGPAQ
jgi:hypothetical protein